MLTQSKTISLFLLFATIGSTHHIFVADADTPQKECTIPGIDGPLPTQVCYDLNYFNAVKKPTAGYQIKIKTECHHRLFYGASGNGLRRLANIYATSCNGILIEYNAQEIVDNYKKFGKAAIESIFKNAREQAAKTKQKVFLYITNIDELPHNSCLNIETPQWLLLVAPYRQTLKLLYAESEKDINSEIFIIWGTHELNNVYSDFLNQLQCPKIPIDLPDPMTRILIFSKIFFEINLLDSLKPACNITLEEMAALNKPFAQDVEELKKLLLKMITTIPECMVQWIHNESCWFEQTKFRETKEAFMAHYNACVSKADLLIKEIDSLRANAVSESDAYHHYSFEKEKMAVFKKSLLKIKFIFLDHMDLLVKFLTKTHGLDKRHIESITKDILYAAEAENNGEITEAILQKKLDELPDPRITALASAGREVAKGFKDIIGIPLPSHP